jgi:hypothetical protein
MTENSPLIVESKVDVEQKKKTEPIVSLEAEDLVNQNSEFFDRVQQTQREFIKKKLWPRFSYYVPIIKWLGEYKV